MITYEFIKELILSNNEVLKQFGVKSIALFGSFSRGEANDESDIDILVSMENYTYRNYAGLRDYLESLTGKKIDLVCQNAIDPRLEEYIESDLKWLVN